MAPEIIFDRDRFYRYLDRDNYRVARDYVRRALRKSRDHPLLLGHLAETYDEEGKFRTALKYYERALNIAPHSPRALADYAGALDAVGRQEEAMRIWKRLLRRGEESIARGPFISGIREARMELNHIRLCMAMSCERAGKTALAARYLRSHIAHRARGVRAAVSLSDAKAFLEEAVLKLSLSRTGDPTSAPQKRKATLAERSEPSSVEQLVAKRVKEHFDREEDDTARQLLRKAVRLYPGDHWFLTHLRSTYYEPYKYKKSARTVGDMAP